MTKRLLVISSVAFARIANEFWELTPLFGASCSVVGVSPFPTVSDPLPVMPAMMAVWPVTVTAPLLMLDAPTLTVVPPVNVQVAPTLATAPAPPEMGLEICWIVTPLVVAEAPAVPPRPFVAGEVGADDVPPVAVAEAVATPTTDVELA